MTRESIQLVPDTYKSHRLWTKRPTAVELSAISVRPASHYTRVWSATTEAVPFFFRLSVLPLRALALFVLWATSSPQRLFFAVCLSVTVVVLFG